MAYIWPFLTYKITISCGNIVFQKINKWSSLKKKVLNVVKKKTTQKLIGLLKLEKTLEIIFIFL